MNIIIGNYGNDTIALIQWAYENRLKNVVVSYVDTGWAAPEWLERVMLCETWVRTLGFNVVRLQAKPDFVELMRGRGTFPSTKFQWCAGMLKGLPLLDWLDTVDSSCEACLLMGKRRAGSRANRNLPEFIEESEHYGDRKVWYPLFQTNTSVHNDLIKRAGFSVLTHRSLECDPCVNSQAEDFKRLSQTVIKRACELEQELQQSMFAPEDYQGAKNVAEVVHFMKSHEVNNTSQSVEVFDMGCGSPFACGE